MVLRALLPLRLEFETLKMILEIGTGVEKAELRVKRSAKKAEKKQEATMLVLRFIHGFIGVSRRTSQNIIQKSK